jgi:plastocyanin
MTALAVVLCAGLALALLVGCSAAPTTPATTTGSSVPATQAPPAGVGPTIAEVNFAFSPTSATAAIGETVSFVNKDSAPHNVSIDGQDLGTQQPGATVTWKPTKAGTFPYSCTIHPQMKGQIVVK